METMDHGGRGQAQRGEKLPRRNVPEVSEPQSSRGGWRQDRRGEWSNRSNPTGCCGTEELRPEYPRRYWDALGGEHKLRHVIELVQVLLLLLLLLLCLGLGLGLLLGCLCEQENVYVYIAVYMRYKI